MPYNSLYKGYLDGLLEKKVSVLACIIKNKQNIYLYFVPCHCMHFNCIFWINDYITLRANVYYFRVIL